MPLFESYKNAAYCLRCAFYAANYLPNESAFYADRIDTLYCCIVKMLSYRAFHFNIILIGYNVVQHTNLKGMTSTIINRVIGNK